MLQKSDQNPMRTGWIQRLSSTKSTWKGPAIVLWGVCGGTRRWHTVSTWQVFSKSTVWGSDDKSWGNNEDQVPSCHGSCNWQIEVITIHDSENAMLSQRKKCGQVSWIIGPVSEPLTGPMISIKEKYIAPFTGHLRNLNWRYLPYIRPM